jgi:hypothetical protein
MNVVPHSFDVPLSLLATLYSAKLSTSQGCRPLKHSPYFSGTLWFTVQPEPD